MDNSIITIVGIIIAFIAGLFITRRANNRDAEILDLTNKLKAKKEDAAKQQEDANKKLKEYTDALKEYDPNFDDDDDPSGHNA